MNRRVQQKADTRARLLDAAAARLRAGGPEGTGVAEVMADAGLTHGGFYGHFDGKAALLEAAFEHAMSHSREAFFGGLEGVHGEDLLRWLAGRYLSTRHRDRPEDGCALASLVGDAARGEDGIAGRFEAEFGRSLARLSAGLDEATDADEPSDEAIAFLALCIGGLLTARAVQDPALSERIMRACRQLAPRLAAADTRGEASNNNGVSRRTEEDRNEL